MADSALQSEIKVLAISGSLRRGSYNTAALRAAMGLLPAGMTLELAEIADLPLYSGDLDGPTQPAPVVRFREKIRAADALLFATPEYNHSVSGVLKNAIDWASRPPTDPVFNGKPVAMLGASMGMFGTARSQLHLRQICAALNLIVLNKPEVMIARAQDKFDASGKLIDEPTAKILRQLLEALADWTRRLRSNL